MSTPATAPPRPDWRDTLAAAADLALLGIAVTAVAAPVLTAGAAIATGTFAARHWCRTGALPPATQLRRVFLRGLLPGLGALTVAASTTAVLALDAWLLASGRVAGGTVALAATAIAAAVLVGVAALTVVRQGQLPDGSWRSAARWALATAVARPMVTAAMVATFGVAMLVAVCLPVTAPILVGYLLFALHVIADRQRVV